MMRDVAVLLTLAVAVAAPARATTFLYPDFASTAGLQLNGSAAAAVDSAGRKVLRVTPSVPFAAGSAFSATAVTLGADVSFSTFFRFNMNTPGGVSDGDGQGGDGLVFVVQTVSNTVGGVGGGIGYLGIPNSVGVEFDTIGNGPALNDPDGNHVGINIGGAFNGPTASVATRLNNSADYWAFIDYDGATNVLELRLSTTSSRPAAPLLSRSVNLAAELGSVDAFVGFTSGTGFAYNHHDIIEWEFRSSFDPIDPVPAPAALGLTGLALGALALRRR